MTKWAWLAAVGGAWAYETFAIVTERKPTITLVLWRYRTRPRVARTIVMGCLAICGVAINHLLVSVEQAETTA